MIQELIKKLSASKGVEKASSKDLKAIPLSKNNFKQLKTPEPRVVFAVDGGSSIIIDGGAWLISKIKVGIVEYNESRKISKIEKNYYITIINREFYEISISDEAGKELNIDLPDFNNYEIDEVPSKVMKILEWKSCTELCSKKGLFILMDSPLEADNKVEEELIKKVSLSENVIVGFCKTSRMRTINGRSLLGVVNNMSEKRTSWYYHPLYEDEELVNTFIAKLNSNAKYCHKVQLFKKEKDVDKVFSVLSYFSRDSEALGYPYPLIKADKVARINSFEKQQEKNKFERELKNSPLNSDALSQSFHAELDKRMYK